MFKKGRNNGENGFTLVEVIVVAVIVAVLALVASMMYRGYVIESRKNTVENTAAAAATFLHTAVNLDCNVDAFTHELDDKGEWNITMPATKEKTFFRCPSNMTITIDPGNKTVTASLKGEVSSPFKYDNQ